LVGRAGERGGEDGGWQGRRHLIGYRLRRELVRRQWSLMGASPLLVGGYRPKATDTCLSRRKIVVLLKLEGKRRLSFPG
jgi:hypothetical protein